MSFNLKKITRASRLAILQEQHDELPAHFIEEVALIGRFASLNSERVLVLNGGCAGRFPCPSVDSDLSIVGIETPIGMDFEPAEDTSFRTRLATVMAYAKEAQCLTSFAQCLPTILLGAPEAFDEYPEATTLADIYDEIIDSAGLDKMDMMLARMGLL